MRIFQTFLLPDNLVAKYNMSFAGCNFSRNLLKNAGFDKVYSLIPWTVSGKLPQINEDGNEVVYSSMRNKGRFLAKIAIFWEQCLLFKKIGKGDSVWFYNLYFLNGLLFLLLKIFKPTVKLNVIVLDFTPATSIRQQNYWCRLLINKADGLMLLADSPFFNCKNKEVLPGVVPSNGIHYPCIRKGNKEFLLSGMISDVIAMTPMVLKAFASLPDCTLHITGSVVNNEAMIKEYASKYDNIIFHGKISYKEYLELLHKITFQLSTRNVESPENKYNFPSKIIESLLHNRVVVSTMNYPQLEGINYAKVDQNNFERDISDLVSNLDKTVARYANQANLVTEKFCAEEWNKSMSKIEANSFKK